MFGSKFFFFSLLLFFVNNFIRERRQVCKECAAAKQRCATSEGAAIKVAQKKMEDVEEGSSSRKKQKSQEDKEVAEAEFSLVVEELWRRVGRRWEELEWWQDQRWAAVTTVLGHIMDNVWELLDGLVPEEKGDRKSVV